jgi:hypothetical protein
MPAKKRDEIPVQPVECRRCGEVRMVPKTGSVGDISRSSGYSPVMLSDTSLLWFCPECLASLRPHIEAIVGATAGEHIYWPHMIALLKDSKDRKGT